MFCIISITISIISIMIGIISVMISAIGVIGIPIQINPERIIHLQELRFRQPVFRGCVPDPFYAGSPGVNQSHLVEHIGNRLVPQFGSSTHHLLIGQTVV